MHGRVSACEPQTPNEQLTCVRAQVRTAQTARALSLSGGSAAHALATCARPVALVVVGPYPTNAYCTSGTAVFLGARPCFGVRAACSKRAADLRACASQKCANRACSLDARECNKNLGTPCLSKRSCCYLPATLPAAVLRLAWAINGAQPPLVCVNSSQKNRPFIRLTGHVLQKLTPPGPENARFARKPRKGATQTIQTN